MTDRFLVLGSGGHALVVADAIRAAGGEVVGYVDRDASRLGKPVDFVGRQVLLTEEALLEELNSAGSLPFEASGLALGIGSNSARDRLFDRLRPDLVPPVIHPRAVVAESASLGAGTVVLAGAVVNAAAAIGEAVIVNSSAVVEHECRVERGVHVSPGAVLAGGVHIGRRTWVGAGAVVIQSLRVGSDAVLGAGSIILRDVPAGATMVGNPGRPLRSDA